MTDNGSCYKSHAFRDFCRDYGLKHLRTKPYTPKTNRKADPPPWVPALRARALRPG